MLKKRDDAIQEFDRKISKLESEYREVKKENTRIKDYIYLLSVAFVIVIIASVLVLKFTGNVVVEFNTGGLSGAVAEGTFSHVTVGTEAPYVQSGYGLLAYYSFDGDAIGSFDAQTGYGTTGATAFDYSSNSYDGTYSGSAIPYNSSTCKYGRCALFGNSGYITLGSTESLLSNDWTISFWAYPTSVYNYEWFSKRTNTVGNGISIVANGGNWLFYADGGGNGWDIASSVNFGTATANQWQMITISKSGTSWNLYVNNALSGNSFTSASSVNANGQTIKLSGGHTDTTNALGYIDDVMIFSQGLSSDQISAIYSAASPRFNTTSGIHTFGVNLGTNTTANITLGDYVVLAGTSISVQINTSISSGNIVEFTNGIITGYTLPAGDLTTAKLNIIYNTDAQRFFSPVAGPNITVEGYGTSAPANNSNAPAILHYLMNDNVASTNVVDSSNNSFNGTANANTDTLTTTGKMNNALSFSGNSIDTKSNFSQLSDKNFTVSTWFKVNSQGSVDGVFSNGASGAYHTMYFTSYHASFGSMYFAWFNDTNAEQYINPGIAPTSGVWHNVIFVKQGTSMNMYYDGQLIGSKTTSATLATPTKNLTLGTDGYGNNFNGNIDDFRIYDYALNSSQIAFIYNASGVAETAHWKMNDNAASATITDSSGNSHTCNLQAQTTQTLTTTGKINSALDNTATSDYAFCDASTIWRTTPFTITFWTNGTSHSGHWLGMDSTAVDSWRIEAGANPYLVTDNIVTAQATTNYNDGNWHMMAATMNATGYIEMYSDSNLEDTHQATATTAVSDTLAFWRTGGDAAMTMALDDVRFYRAVLTSDQIATIYAGGSGTEASLQTVSGTEEEFGVSVVADTTFPLVSLVYPTNITYTISSLGLNYTASDETALSACWYFNGTGNTTITCGNNATITASEGSNTWIVYANDTSNNLNSTSVTFTVNVEVPAHSLNITYTGLSNYEFNSSNTLNMSGLTCNYCTNINVTGINMNWTSGYLNFSNSNNTLITGVNMTNLPMNNTLITLSGGYSNQILNSQVVDSIGDLIKISNETNFIIAGNNFTEDYIDALSHGTAIYGFGSNGGIILNNTFYQTNWGGGYGFEIYSNLSSNLSITGNMFNFNQNYEGHVYARNGNNILISENTFGRCSGDPDPGVYFVGVTNSSMLNNNMNANSTGLAVNIWSCGGAYISGSTNVLMRNNSMGSRIFAAVASSNNVTIDNNNMTYSMGSWENGAESTLGLSDGGNYTVTNNIINNVNLNGSSIYFNLATGNLVASGNTIIGSKYGIRARSDSLAQNVLIANNTISNVIVSINLTQTTSVTVTNTTYAAPEYVSSGSILTRNSYLTAQANDSYNGQAVPSTYVIVKNSSGSTKFAVTSDANGTIAAQLLQAYVNNAGTTTYPIYNLTANATGYGASFLFNLSTSLFHQISMDTTINPGVSYSYGTPINNDVDSSIFVNITGSNFVNVTYYLYNSTGLHNTTAYASAINSTTFNVASGSYSYQVNVTDSYNHQNGTALRNITILPSCACTEGINCTISSDCYLNNNSCSGGLCQFTNLTISASLYTLYDGNGNGNNLYINLTSNETSPLTFLTGGKIIFNGRNGTDITGLSSAGGNAGLVNITVQNLLNTTYAFFYGIGGTSTSSANGGNGGNIGLYFHGLIRMFTDGSNQDGNGDLYPDNTPILAGGSSSGLPGNAGTATYSRTLSCPLDPDIDADGVVFNLDRDLTKNAYANRTGDSTYISSQDINCDNFINVIELSREGFQWETRGQQ